MGANIVKNDDFLPHHAIVLTNNVKEFELKKIIPIYNRSQHSNFNLPVWELEIHPTDTCILNCKGCSYKKRHALNEISYKKLLKISIYLRDNGLKSIFLSGGGDPTNWTMLENFLNDVKNPKIKIGISTNLYNMKNLQNVIDKIDLFQLHLIGYDQKSVIKECGKNIYNTLDINYLNLFKKRKKNQKITIKVLLRNENYKDINKYLSYIDKFNCDTVVIKLEENFYNYHFAERNIDLNRIRNDVVNHKLYHKFNYCIDNLDDIIFNNPIPKQCYVANSNIYTLIRANGDIYPCVAGTNNLKNKIGNICDFNYNTNYELKVCQHDYEMKNKNCPLEACRHYRFNSIIERYINGERFSLFNDDTPLI